jgi:hypothetical protein
MSFLLTLDALDTDGTVLDTDTVIVDAEPFYGFEKGLRVLGATVTLRLRCDPPLVVDPGAATVTAG